MKNSSISIFHLNKGNSLFPNKTDDIYTILDKYRPKILSLSKANYDITTSIRIRDYIIKYTDMGKGLNISRQVLIHQFLQYTRRRILKTRT